MEQELHIRAAEQEDVHGLLEIYEHLNPGEARCPVDEAVVIFRRFLLYPGSAILIGTVGDEYVATCSLVIVPNLTRGGRSIGLIENVVTHANYRNRGFGKAMLRAATKRAWAEGCYKAMLLTGSRKPETLGFYEAAGFQQTKTGFEMRRLPRRDEIGA